MPIYLDIPGIAGESAPDSTNTNWQNKIDVRYWTYSISVNTSMEVGTGLASSGSTAGHMNVTKTMDVSTPLLFEKLCKGDIIPVMTLRETAMGSTGGIFEGETYELQNVIVSHYTTSGADGMGGMPEEQWRFAFTTITETYNTTDEDGNQVGAIVGGHDFAKGVPTA
jgi:type VI protein secretion system component Hcp